MNSAPINGGVNTTTVVSTNGPTLPPTIQQNIGVSGVSATNGFSEPGKSGSATTTTGSSVYLAVPNQPQQQQAMGYPQQQQQQQQQMGYQQPQQYQPQQQQEYQQPQQPIPYQQPVIQSSNNNYQSQANNGYIPEATIVSVQPQNSG